MKTKKERAGNSIIHVQIGEQHAYFGSISAIYDIYTSKQLKIAKGSLWNYKVTTTKPYSNSVCTIRKGSIHRKKRK